jgi:hypothetical protein
MSIMFMFNKDNMFFNYICTTLWDLMNAKINRSTTFPIYRETNKVK